MATNWTDAQLKAITSRDKTLLVSAAAGSGKTATLTERIIRKLTDADAPVDISDMLIVTFTRASAADLRAKISAALREALANDPVNAHLTKQLVKLSSAHISTIDSFYLDAVRKNFAKLSLSSGFRIADDSETDLLAKNVMNEVILSFYETNEQFPRLCECFEKIRDTGDVMHKVLTDLYDKCMHVPEGVEYLAVCAKECASASKDDFLTTKYGAIIKEYCISALEDFLIYYDSALAACYENEKLSKLYAPALENDRKLCLEILAEFKKSDVSYRNVANILNAHAFAKLGSLKSEFANEDSIFCKELRKAFKSFINDLCDDFFCYSDADFAHFYDKTSQNLSLLYDVLHDFHVKFMAEKKRRNILELTDVKRYAYDLFVSPDGKPTQCAQEYSELFSEIYIDEYQDVDPVQDAIFSAISTPTNRFMVGDIKQSIYSFRGAEPSLFAHYRSSFAPISDNTANACTIFMSENFRCSKQIIDFTNLVCSPLFTACGQSIGYTTEDDLVYGLKNDPTLYPEINVALFAKDSKKNEDSAGEDADTTTELKASEAEAEYVAERISEILNNGKKADGTKILPKDIALLFRNNKASSRFADALSKRGIKTTVTDSAEYFQNPDVLMVLCILNAVDNPQRDVYLAGALRSPIFNFSLEDILFISKLGCDSDSLYDKLCIAAEGDGELAKHCADFNEQLCALRRIATSLPIDKFLIHLFSTDSFVASGLFSERSTAGEGGNLLRLYEYARSFESGSFKGLYNFIEFINTIIENGTTLEAVSKGGADDCVTLTTIHKSKGLEFPVCFVCNTGANMRPTRKNSLSFAYGTGIAMDLADNTGFARYESPLKRILDLRDDLLSREEEMRVLYVALTRAREQLYITGSFSQRTLPNVRAAAEFAARFNCRYSTITRPSYLDWVLSALNRTATLTNVFEYQPNQISAYNKSSKNAVDNCATEDATLTAELTKRFSFVYPYSALRRIPAKLSISRLSPDVLDDNDISFSPFEERKPTAVPSIFLETNAKMATSAERGTATHNFLQFCDFAYAKEHGVDTMIHSLIEKRFIPKEFESLIYKKEIQRLLDGEFCDRILRAKQVIRERRFNILLPASHFTLDEELKSQITTEMIAVQGVIDLILINEDDSIELYDYKTDRLTREELANDALATEKMKQMHSEQLRYYAEAVKQLFGKAPDTVAIYSTCAGKLYELV